MRLPKLAKSVFHADCNFAITPSEIRETMKNRFSCLMREFDVVRGAELHRRFAELRLRAAAGRKKRTKFPIETLSRWNQVIARNGNSGGWELAET